MSQLILYYNHLILFYIFLYVKLWAFGYFIFFYPVGIFFSVCILFYLFVSLQVASSLVNWWFRMLYYFWPIEIVFDFLYNFKFLSSAHYLWGLLTDLILNNSDYFFVFHLKRLQFIVFWVSVILIFC